MASFTLNDIIAAADAKYGTTDIDLGEQTVVLINALRLSDAKRAELEAVQKRMSAAEDDESENADQAAMLRDALRIVAKTPDQAEALIAALGEDLALLVEVFERYSKGTQAGEASPSVD